VSLETYKGKALLVVNVASKWYQAVRCIILAGFFFFFYLGLWDVEMVCVSDAVQRVHGDQLQAAEGALSEVQGQRSGGVSLLLFACLFLNYGHL
jgi:hypothetical protein